MSSRWIFVLACVPALASAAPGASDRGSFQRELDKVFSGGGLTADAAARRAAKQAPVVARKAASLRAASADLSRAKLSLVPIVGGKASYTRLSPVDAVVIPLGAQSFVIPFFEDNYDVSGQVTVNASDYFMRDPALIQGASLALDVARLDAKASSASVALQAREIYYEWLRAKLQVLVAKQQLTQVEATLAQIKSLVDVQRASTADLMRIESQRSQARQIVDRLDNGVALREEQLRLLIGAADGEDLTVGEDVRVELEIESGDLDELSARAAARRTELRLVDTGIRAKEAQRRAEASTLIPRLSAFAAVDYGNPNPRIFPQDDVYKLTWAAGVQASWVINESLAGNQTRNRSAAEADELRADRRNLQHQIRLEVLRALQGVRIARRAIEISQQGVEAAEESYRVRRDLFGANRASVVEMVDAETELSRARIAALDARIDLRIAVARLAYSTGDSQR